MAKRSHRAKPDALYHLVKTIDSGTYLKLHGYKAHFGQETKEWKLIDYYRKLNVWSKEIEQRDWQHENLAFIKHSAYRWLKKALVKLGDHGVQDHYSICHLLVNIGEFEEAFDEARVGYELAMAHEEFGIAKQFISIERQMAGLVLDAERYKSVCEDISMRLATAQEQESILNEIESHYSLAFEPMKKLYQSQAVPDPNLLAQMQVGVQRFLNLPETSIKANWLKWRMLVYIGLRMGEVSTVLRSSENLIKIDKDHPWVAGLYQYQHFSTMVSIAAFYAYQGKSAKAIEILDDVKHRCNNLKPQSFTGIDVVAKGYALVGSIIDDPDLVMQARGALETHYNLIKRKSSPGQLAYLLFMSSVSALQNGEYEISRKYCLQIIQMKAFINPHFYQRSRILYLICIIPTCDPDHFYAEYSAVKKAFARQDLVHEVLNNILDKVYKKYVDVEKILFKQVENGLEKNFAMKDPFWNIDWEKIILQVFNTIKSRPQ